MCQSWRLGLDARFREPASSILWVSRGSLDDLPPAHLTKLRIDLTEFGGGILQSRAIIPRNKNKNAISAVLVTAASCK
jgi:hypothetical protein